jgi:hypothetical protein
MPRVALMRTHLIGDPLSNDKLIIVSVVDVVEPLGVNVTAVDVVVLE